MWYSNMFRQIRVWTRSHVVVLPRVAAYQLHWYLFPLQDWMGTPLRPDLGWGTPPSMTGWGTPLPPIQDWMGCPRPTRRQSSITSTCYVAGSMPLVFTQEDFLVNIYVCYAISDRQTDRHTNGQILTICYPVRRYSQLPCRCGVIKPVMSLAKNLILNS